MSKTIAIEVWSRHLDDPTITLWACGEGEGALDPENLLIKALRRCPVFPEGLIEHKRPKSIVVELAHFDRAFTVEEVRQEEPTARMTNSRGSPPRRLLVMPTMAVATLPWRRRARRS